MVKVRVRVRLKMYTEEALLLWNKWFSSAYWHFAYSIVLPAWVMARPVHNSGRPSELHVAQRDPENTLMLFLNGIQLVGKNTNDFENKWKNICLNWCGFTKHRTLDVLPLPIRYFLGWVGHLSIQKMQYGTFFVWDILTSVACGLTHLKNYKVTPNTNHSKFTQDTEWYFHPCNTYRRLITSQLIRFHRICPHRKAVETATHTLFTPPRPRGYSEALKMRWWDCLNQDWSDCHSLCG